MSHLLFGKTWWLINQVFVAWAGVSFSVVTIPMINAQGRASESSRHIMKCTGTGADNMTFVFAIQKFETSLTALEMAPAPIITLIIKRLRQWQTHGDHALPRFPSWDRWHRHKAVLEQHSIGWYQFLLRRMDTLQKCNTGRRWAVSHV
jgi:hypothetical protein